MAFIYHESFFRTCMKILWAFMQVSILDGRTMGCGSGISLPGMFRVVTDKTVRGF
jgi:enoyl-CoA hydratase/carnithine racemase